MSSTPTSVTNNVTKSSNQAAFSRGRAKTANWHLTSEGIAADIATFKKRGGRIEVLGNTPLRSRLAPTTFRSNEKSKGDAAAAPAAKSATGG